MAEKYVLTKDGRIDDDLTEVASLLQSIEALLQTKMADGSFDDIDVAIRLAARRSGQLIEAIYRSSGNPGLRDLEAWLPGPKSLRA
jgi:hypothetical protein